MLLRAQPVAAGHKPASLLPNGPRPVGSLVSSVAHCKEPPERLSRCTRGIFPNMGRTPKEMAHAIGEKNSLLFVLPAFYGVIGNHYTRWWYIAGVFILK